MSYLTLPATNESLKTKSSSNNTSMRIYPVLFDNTFSKLPASTRCNSLTENQSFVRQILQPEEDKVNEMINRIHRTASFLPAVIKAAFRNSLLDLTRSKKVDVFFFK